MELKEFVEESINQIIDGIIASQIRNKENGAIISPSFIGDKSSQTEVNGKNYTVSKIDFEVALTTTDESGTKAGIGVLFGYIGGSVQGEQKNKNAAITSLKFSIPVAYPQIETKERKIPKSNVPY